MWIFMVISFPGKANSVDSLFVEYGGGITGQVTEYKIVQNSVYKWNYRVLKSGKPQIAKVSSKQLKKIFKASDQLFNKKEGFDRPGNLYKSIQIYSKGKKVQYKWGENSFEPPDEVKELYDQILNLIKDLNFKL